MISLYRHVPLAALVAAIAFSALAAGELRADAKASGGVVTLLHDEPGHSGGQVSSGNVTLETSTGAPVGGAVSDLAPGGILVRSGYTGQLYDPHTLALSASPGTTLNEGDAALLSADLVLDDGTTLSTDAIQWSVLSGPATIGYGGLAIAGGVTANTAATIGASFSGLNTTLDLTILNLSHQATPLSWEPDAANDGPYRVWLGTAPSSLRLVSTESSAHYNPGPLALGTTYYYQIFDSRNNDITPGGPGPQTFRTALYRPDIRLGKKLRLSSHRGNGIYNSNGGGQTLKIALTGKRKAKAYFSVENDGDSIDNHTIRGTGARKKLKLVRYFRLTMGRMNVTATAIRLGYSQPKVNPKGVFIYQIQAKARGIAPARQNLNLIARSVGDARALDIARAKLKTTVKKDP